MAWPPSMAAAGAMETGQSDGGYFDIPVACGDLGPLPGEHGVRCDLTMMIWMWPA